MKDDDGLNHAYLIVCAIGEGIKTEKFSLNKGLKPLEFQMCYVELYYCI